MLDTRERDGNDDFNNTSVILYHMFRNHIIMPKYKTQKY